MESIRTFAIGSNLDHKALKCDRVNKLTPSHVVEQIGIAINMILTLTGPSCFSVVNFGVIFSFSSLPSPLLKPSVRDDMKLKLNLLFAFSDVFLEEVFGLGIGWWEPVVTLSSLEELFC